MAASRAAGLLGRLQSSAALCLTSLPSSRIPASNRALPAGSMPSCRGQSRARSSHLSMRAGPAADSLSSAASVAGMYDQPQLYEDVFSYRDLDSEVKFLTDLYRQFAKGSKLSSVLELGPRGRNAQLGRRPRPAVAEQPHGCGPGVHSVRLAKKGLAVTALDLSPVMLAHARSKAQEAGVELELLEGDMQAFDLQDRHERYDMALCLLGTFSHVLDNRAAAATLRCVARHLRPGGILVLELAHPGDLFDGTLMVGDSGVELWEVERNGRKLMVQWGTEMDQFDPVSQVLDRTVTVNEMRGEEVVKVLAEDVMQYRQYTTQVMAMYGEMRTDVGLDHQEAYRLVACLKRL